VSIEDVAAELYGLTPEEFTAARNARVKEVKAAGDAELAREVQALRKPTAGAWLLNQLVRRHGDVVQQVLDLGAQLRAAQGTLGADELRALDRQRRQLTRAVAEQARALGRDAGRRVTDQTTADVEETLRSAMVDAAAGAALSTGLLTDTFSSTGIEPVDLSRVVALAPSITEAPVAASGDSEPAAGAGTPDRAHQRRVEKAKAGVVEAVSAVDEARERVELAAQAATAAQRDREGLEAQRDEARRLLDDLDAQVASATETEDAAAREREEAQAEEASAVEAAGRLRDELEELLGGS
jgi:hypothetical protein